MNGDIMQTVSLAMVVFGLVGPLAFIWADRRVGYKANITVTVVWMSFCIALCSTGVALSLARAVSLHMNAPGAP